MKKKLYPFQTIGAKFLATHPHALLGDEPGLGKTVQAIAAVETLDLRNILVVCPASVRSNWKQEVTECLGLTRFSRWMVISYNEAASGEMHDPSVEWDAIILDEAHFLKTPDSQRTRAIFANGTGLARQARFKWCLTGTPVLNRPRELYPVLKTLATKNIEPYTTFASFAQRFCGAYFDGRGINTRGASHLDDLRARLEGFMLRRTKAEVLPELPPKIISHIPLEVSEKELKEVFAEEETIQNREAYLSSTFEQFAQLGDLARLLRLTGEAKVPAACSFIEDLLETVDKVVVFAHHREVIKRLEARLAGRGYAPAVLHGGMSDVQKQEAITIFKSQENVRVFIGQIQAAGTGINGLQSVAHSVIFAELSWVPGIMAQAIDRCHRIGQNAESVNVYLLHIPDTLESAVLGVQGAKEKIIEKLMGVQ